jgi:hypothetical protein
MRCEGGQEVFGLKLLARCGLKLLARCVRRCLNEVLERS